MMIIFLNRIKYLAFIMQSQCVFCKVVTELSDVILIRSFQHSLNHGLPTTIYVLSNVESQLLRLTLCSFLQSHVTASSTMGTGGALPGGETCQGMKLTNHFHLVTKSRMVEIYLHSPIRLHGIAFN
jgi:hypothetical protein